ncbi:uncharacterized protein LOC111703934 isoform X2 [Eurytemora carolleeae]|uniref:uncharacterized protein LOC111703934 isoform X2 n=1 Tax=Eurytemora carolleeae TaxID=1294199 RepID=UPI000C77D697|nr:uncharacterized protein LOC111703934 isoform X2 [Eurytemora carolleeae]|eukprot:XP_023331801.1 uncharacterized protein LOC111703934 isoform X2 [Eurytemora affinis]
MDIYSHFALDAVHILGLSNVVPEIDDWIRDRSLESELNDGDEARIGGGGEGRIEEGESKKLDFQIPDLTGIGINISQTFDDLLSPAGIVNQFVLSIFFQIVSIVGYAIAGGIYLKIAASVTSGPLLPAITYFSRHFSAQAVFDTVVRSLILMIWELIMRLVTVFAIFGIVDTVTQVLDNVTLDTMYLFITSPILSDIMIWRIIVACGALIPGFYFLPALGPAGPAAVGSAVGKALDTAVQVRHGLL